MNGIPLKPIFQRRNCSTLNHTYHIQHLIDIVLQQKTALVLVLGRLRAYHDNSRIKTHYVRNFRVNTTSVEYPPTGGAILLQWDEPIDFSDADVIKYKIYELSSGQ